MEKENQEPFRTQLRINNIPLNLTFDKPILVLKDLELITENSNVNEIQIHRVIDNSGKVYFHQKAATIHGLTLR